MAAKDLLAPQAGAGKPALERGKILKGDAGNEQVPSRAHPSRDLVMVFQKGLREQVRTNGVKMAGNFRPLELAAKERPAFALVDPEIFFRNQGRGPVIIVAGDLAGA